MQARRQHRLPPRAVASPYLFSGLLICGVCGRRLNGTIFKHTGLRYYICRGNKQLVIACNVRTRADGIEAAVVARLNTPESIAGLVAELQATAAADPIPRQAAALDQQIARAERGITGLLDLAEIRRRLAEREQELAALRTQRVALPAQRQPPFDAAGVQAALAQITVGLTLTRTARQAPL